MFPKDIDPLAFATYRRSSARHIVRTAMGIPAPSETDEQMLQLSEDHKDPDDVEETGNLLTLSLNDVITWVDEWVAGAPGRKGTSPE
ncbi:hypothetical protein AVEN_44612-1 [Araneus ventricosus]|uniref:Uncharacterized protein n=1 Tax=Araneus ventricosus TaxID=182803 RepID=A0A4Y2LCT3_ARAVE|nr:hypothetical protein AVEN_44612-1 [Araneus ventricosus]